MIHQKMRNNCAETLRDATTDINSEMKDTMSVKELSYGR